MLRAGPFPDPKPAEQPATASILVHNPSADGCHGAPKWDT